MPDRFSLQDKSAIITGATRGIGLAIARSFVEQGASVTLCSRKQGNVDQAVDALSEYQTQVFGFAANVGHSEDIAKLVSASTDRFGPISILVNNAGTNPYFGPILDSEERAWDKTMDVNVKGPYILSQACAKSMIELGSGGSIINVASVAGLAASPLQGIYSVSKAALIMLTKVMAKELGSNGVRVNCICPGLIKTQLSKALWDNPDLESSITSMKALGRMGTVDEISGAALYLASEASSFTTGAILQIDGGMVI